MCSNYEPETREQYLLRYFGVKPEKLKEKIGEVVWPTHLAPFIRLHEDGSGNRIIEDGMFGLLPHFAKELAFGRKTYNARCETVDQKPSYRDAWKKGRRCIVPAQVVYETSYESGKAVRWRVHQPSGIPFGIAGIYNQWRAPDGKLHWTFAMLTCNAEGHPVYKRFHRPGDEKRMIVIIADADYERWLTCSPEEAKAFFRQWTGELETSPVSGVAPRRAKSSAERR